MKPILAALLCASALGVAAPVLAQPYPPRPEAAAPGHDLRGQLETLEGQIREGVRDHQLDQGEFDRATRELNSIRDQEQALRARGGGLSDADRGMLQQRIDQLARSIHFMRDHGPTPGTAPPPVVAQPYPSRPDAAAPGHDLRGQLDTLEGRVREGVRDHQIDDREFDRAIRELTSIRDQERDLRARRGGELSDVDRGMLQQRIDQLARTIHWMRDHGPMPGVTPPPPVVVPAPPPPMGPGAWSLSQREDWLQQRIVRGRADGSLDRREAYRAQRALNDIRSTQAHLMRRDRGRLTDTDRMYIEQRLDRLRDGLHWMRDNGERAPWARP